MTSAPDALPPLLTAAVDGGTFRLRRATRGDLPAVVRLLADDALGAARFLPGISRQGAWRSQLEGVRVAPATGAGTALAD